jgi:hypothetical protein
MILDSTDGSIVWIDVEKESAWVKLAKDATILSP